MESYVEKLKFLEDIESKFSKGNAKVKEVFDAYDSVVMSVYEHLNEFAATDYVDFLREVSEVSSKMYKTSLSRHEKFKKEMDCAILSCTLSKIGKYFGEKKVLETLPYLQSLSAMSSEDLAKSLEASLEVQGYKIDKQ